MPLNSPSSSSNGPLLQNDDSRQALVDSQAHASKQIAAALLDRPTAKQRLLARLVGVKSLFYNQLLTPMVFPGVLSLTLVFSVVLAA